MKQSFADILRKIDDRADRKIAAKLPQWSGVDGIEIPSSLNFEQCSSSAAAMFKAKLLSEKAGASPRIADLTGGLGSDSWAFSRVAEQVLYNEMDPGLAGAVERNMGRLGVRNISFSSIEIRPDNVELWKNGLEEFGPDIIYADPARRSASGKKVFLLEDCSPNILEILPVLSGIAPILAFKLSPMADMKMVASRLSGAGISACGHRGLKDIYAIGLKGEVKELLCIMDREFDGEYTIHAADAVSGEEFSFRPSEEEAAEAGYVRELKEGDIVFEPSPAILKTGAFKLLCARYGMKKFAPSTHLYIAPEAVAPGRSLEIVEILPLNGTNMKTLGKAHPHAEVCAMNIPMSSEQLSARMGVKPGPADCRIYGASAMQGRFLLVTRPQ